MAEPAIDYGSLVLAKLNNNQAQKQPEQRKNTNNQSSSLAQPPNGRKSKTNNDHQKFKPQSGEKKTEPTKSDDAPPHKKTLLKDQSDEHKAGSSTHQPLKPKHQGGKTKSAVEKSRAQAPQPSHNNETSHKNQKTRLPKKSLQSSKQTELEPVASDSEDERELILREIKALGGDETDLELVDLPDDLEEMEGAPVNDPKLESDLKRFMTGLDFANARSFESASKPVEKKPQAIPAPTKAHQTQSAMTNMAALEAKLEDPLEKAKLDKREAKINQRRIEAKKRDEKIAEEQERMEVEARQKEKQETCEKVNDVKQRLAPGNLSIKCQTWLTQPQPIWYDTSYLPPLPSSDSAPAPVSDAILTKLQNRGNFVLSAITDNFAQSIQPVKESGMSRKTTFGGLSESDKAFIHKILSSGTSGDKLSALTLLVSSAPLQSKPHLSTLLNLCKKKNREEAGRTMRAVVEWLRGGGNSEIGGLPARKLKYFRDQSGLPSAAQLQGLLKGKSKSKTDEYIRIEGDEWLALWAFEDWLKKWYLELLQTIESFSHDPLVFTRNQSISHLYNLLCDKPEQEQNLLTLLVSKLGDGDKTVCSRSSHYLLQLLQQHPLMKAIVIREVSVLVLKPIPARQITADRSKKSASDQGLRHHDHGRYYGTITLNQIALAKGDADISNRLIEVYFLLFNDILGRVNKEEQDAEDPVEKNEEDLEAENERQQKMLSKKSRGAKNKGETTIKSKAAKSAKEISEEEAQTEKRSRLMAAILTGLNRAFPYSSLTDEVFGGHVNTLFRIIHTSTFNVSIQALILVQQLVVSKPTIADRFYRALYGTLFDHRLINATSKQALYLNLMFKALKADSNSARILAFVKRITQILLIHQPSFVCATLVLLSELFEATGPICQHLLSSSQPKDLKDEGPKLDGDDQAYDGRKRDPNFANAMKTCLWELIPLSNHYHPAVSLNARQLLMGEKVSSSVDLEHHTLISFLDRFVYRKPKKQSAPKGSAIMQPDLHGKLGNVVKVRKNEIEMESINSRNFSNRTEGEVPVDEVFLHKFFTKKAINDKKHEDKRVRTVTNEAEDFGGRGGSDDGSSEEDLDENEEDLPGYDSQEEDDEEGGGSDKENEEEIWKVMKKSMNENFNEDVPDEDDESWTNEIHPKDFDSDDGELKGLLDEGSDLEEIEEISVVTIEDDDVDSSMDENQPKNVDLKSSGKKRNLEQVSMKEERKKKRKVLKNLPIFATADDYAQLVSGDESD